MVGDLVIADGEHYVIVWDGSLGPRTIVTPRFAPTVGDRPCACGCGLMVARPKWYASQACSGRANRGIATPERFRRTG